VTAAESPVEGPLIENAGGAFSKIFKTCGELGASSVTVRVSLRGPENNWASAELAKTNNTVKRRQIRSAIELEGTYGDDHERCASGRTG
jgi:hypothetical protein